MHLSLAIIAAGLLRILPSCSASPMAAVASPAKAPAKQSKGTTSSPCSNPAASGTSADCWTSLGMDTFLANWTQETVIAGAPMIGTIVCRPTEGWAQCFIRFAYGLQRQTTAPMDCVSLSSTSCSPPSQQMLKPTSPEYWYGVQAIYSVFMYFKTLASALLTTTGTPGALETLYASALFGIGAAGAPNPIDAVLFSLLELNGFSDQDKAFNTYMSTEPYTSASNTSRNQPSDNILYTDLTKSLETRLGTIMGNFTAFESMLGTGAPWISGAQTSAAQYVKAWTDISPTTQGFLDAQAAAAGVSTAK
ncbi:hypothetical protein XPA_004983 [Xanthoria parietina]